MADLEKIDEQRREDEAKEEDALKKIEAEIRDAFIALANAVTEKFTDKEFIRSRIHTLIHAYKKLEKIPEFGAVPAVITSLEQIREEVEGYSTPEAFHEELSKALNLSTTINEELLREIKFLDQVRKA